jgi:hypothetical protein
MCHGDQQQRYLAYAYASCKGQREGQASLPVVVVDYPAIGAVEEDPKHLHRQQQMVSIAA